MAESCCLYSWVLSGIKPKQLHSATPLVQHRCLSFVLLSYLTSMSLLWQRDVLSFLQGDTALMKTDCRNGNTRRVPRSIISGKKRQQQKLIALKLRFQIPDWEKLGNCVFYLRNTWWVIIKEAKLQLIMRTFSTHYFKLLALDEDSSLMFLT